MRWLRYRFYCEEKTDDDVEPPPLKDQVVGDVVRQLEAKAQFEGQEHLDRIGLASSLHTPSPGRAPAERS